MTELSRLAAIPAMLDYDREAASYDVTRGGDARASAAAEAIESLLPPAADRPRPDPVYQLVALRKAR